MIIFGYQSSSTSIYLYEDGTLICISEGRTAAFSVMEESMRKIRRLLDENRLMLEECASRINGRAVPETENCFIFGNCRIADWDLTRWYMEEDRSKHPDYYDNTVKVGLVENIVRAVFDEVCDVIGEKGNRLLYGRTLLRGI